MQSRLLVPTCGPLSFLSSFGKPAHPPQTLQFQVHTAPGHQGRSTAVTITTKTDRQTDSRIGHLLEQPWDTFLALICSFQEGSSIGMLGTGTLGGSMPGTAVRVSLEIKSSQIRGWNGGKGQSQDQFPLGAFWNP